MTASDPRDAIVSNMQESRRRFLALVEAIRPELHRYCARMVGSTAEGEDVVQDTLARAYYELPELKEVPPLRPWLFRIAHNRAIDLLRRYERKMSEPLDSAADLAIDAALASEAVARAEAVRLAVSRFLEIAPAQRSAVILKDVLDHSLEEIATLLELSIPAVKAALHRGRQRLRELSAMGTGEASAQAVSPVLARYAALFNARDWDGVRALLIDEVKLDLVSREKRRGRADVEHYFHNYDETRGWHLVPGWLEGRHVLAVFGSAGDARLKYFIELTLAGDRIATIRDFRYVPYIAGDARVWFPAGT